MNNNYQHNMIYTEKNCNHEKSSSISYNNIFIDI